MQNDGKWHGYGKQPDITDGVELAVELGKINPQITAGHGKNNMLQYKSPLKMAAA